MSLHAPVVADTGARLAHVNPVAKITAVMIVTVALVVTVDLVTPTVVLAAELAMLPATGLRLRPLLRRCWPLAVGVAGVAASNLLVVDGGRTLLDLGPVDVTSRAVASAIAVSLRLMAIALPGIVMVAATDPMDLADALVQRWHVSPRFAYGALAALRLLPLLSADWRTIGLARRARGMDAGRNPVTRGRLFASQTFAVLVGSIRRGVRLSRAMEARGFDAGGRRTVARPQPLRSADWWLIGATLVVVLFATAASVSLGTWSPAVGG